MKDSSFIQKVSWVKGQGAIEVTFKSGAIWLYPAKSHEYATLHRVNSPGTYFNRVLKARPAMQAAFATARERAATCIHDDCYPKGSACIFFGGVVAR